MTNSIITDNVYLELALGYLCPTKNVESDLLFVDLGSFHDLSDMMKSIRQKKISIDTKVCLIGTSSGNFRILARYALIKITDSLMGFKQQIANRKFPTLCEVENYLAHVIDMSIFTNRQRQCLYAFKLCGEVNSASKALGLSKKTVYSVMRSAGRRINLTTLLQIRQFLSSDYSV